MEIFDVIIVGAGASGLASAWYLSKNGLKVGCFEQGDYIQKDSLVDIKDGGELQKFSFLSFDPNQRKRIF